MRKTRNSIITSAISLLLCIIMLAGSTFAWFTDIVASNGNIIQSGNLDAQLHWSDKLLDADSSEWIDAEGSKVFDYDRWEPGYTELRYIKVTNAGSLNLKWKLTVEANGPVTSLADVIEVYYVNPVTGEIASLDGLESVGTLTEVMAEKTSSQGRLTPKQNAILAIAFHMDEYAGNEYQEISLCDNGFSLKLLATQDVGESDSFGDDYDIDADWGEGTITFTASAPISQVPMIYGSLAGDITIGSGSNISALLPSGVKVAEGATSLDLSVSAVDTDSNITLGDGDSAKSLDVHVYGVATDNTVPMIVNLGAVLEAGLGDTELKLYHTEDGSPVLMTRVDSTSDFAIHNQYTYNTETGEVSIYVKSFSVFSAVKTSADEWDGTSDTSWYNENDTEFTLVTAEQFAGFRDLVDAGNTFEGKTVKLGADIDLKDTLFDPIGFGYYKDNKVVDGVDNNTVFLGTFDGGNHTIYNLYQNGWELDPDKTNYSTYTYSTAGAGLFASIKNATIKNLAISGAEVVFECVDMGVLVGYAQGECHFENIVITNANIANYNRYTGGLVGEVSYGPYGTDTSLGYSHTFKNITIDSNVKVSGLWGSFGCGMGGVIGGKWNDATVYMENVISAAEMDVYNDVVSAYQWYAFRGCGMLIGHTEEPYSDGRTSGIATASFLTCENVKVYYGDWVNYTYYEFENQDSGTGRSYPWVRAEAGEYCDAFSNIRYGVPTHNGVKVSDLTDEELKAVATDYTPIVFDQLYGADRGMYGQAAHDGVTVLKKNVKTVYIHNNGNWTNLKLDYWYKNGDDTWTNLSEGIDISDKLLENNIYKIEVPSYAYGFKITADGEKKNKEFIVSELIENETYALHNHEFVGGTCNCGATQVETWEKLTSESELKIGDLITFVYEGEKGKFELSSISATSTNYGIGTGYESLPNGVMVFEVVKGSKEGTFAFKNGNNYLCWSSGNSLGMNESLNSDACWTVSADVNGNATVKNGKDSTRIIQWNTQSPRFACYTSTQAAISIYVKTNKVQCSTCVMNIVDYKDASCGVAGYTVEKCSVCGSEVRIELKALEHDYNGENPYICTNNCGIHNLPEDGSTITIEQALWIAETLEKGKETSNKYIITGTIDDKDHPSSTGATTITADGKSIYITNIHNVDGTIRHDVFVVKLQDGDKITISAKIAKNDSGEAQLHETRLASHIDNNIADHTCDICGASEITDHIDEDSNNKCDVCGNDIEGGSSEPEVFVEKTVSMNIFANQGLLANKVITWISGDVTVSNAQGSSKTAIRTSDSDHYRVYNSSVVTISVPNSTITKVVITCSSGYANGISMGAQNAGYAVTQNGTVVTITVSDVSEITFTASEQARITKVEVTYTTDGSEGDNGGEVPVCTSEKCDKCGGCLNSGCEICENICSGCVVEPTILAKFEFGENGSASHSDGSEKTSYKETNNGYTLTLSNMSKVYGSARDAKGNSALKLGTSSATGKFSFTVADDVTKVVIYVAQYKANTTKITVNGTSYTITTASDKGEYTAIEIDTSTTKTVTFTTASGGYRAMVNTIEYYS